MALCPVLGSPDSSEAFSDYTWGHWDSSDRTFFNGQIAWLGDDCDDLICFLMIDMVFKMF